MPAAMVHGGGGVLLMIMTKIASQQTKKARSKQDNIKKKIKHQITHNKFLHNRQHKITSKNNNHNKHPPSNKLTAQIQYFQMRKLDQR